MNTQLPGAEHARASSRRMHRGRSLLALAAASLVTLTGLSGVALADSAQSGTSQSGSAETSPGVDSTVGAEDGDAGGVDRQADSADEDEPATSGVVSETGGARTNEAESSARTSSARSTAALAPSAASADETVLYEEDFENGVNQSNPPTSLNDYVGADGRKYTAAPYWLDAGYCNGFVTSANVPVTQGQIDQTYCGRNLGYDPGDYMAVQVKAYELGLLQGLTNADALNNHALSTNTSGGRPSTDITSDHSIMFRTDPDTPIALPETATGRFIAFSVDAANTYCANAYHPQMRFQYVQDGTTTDLPLGSTGYIDPCTSTGGTTFTASSQFPAGGNSWVNTGSSGTFYSGSFLLTSSSPVGLILRNVSPASSTGKGIGNSFSGNQGNANYVAGTLDGNDGAIDNIRIVDVTPSMTKSFSPTTVSVGRTSTMTLTINNKSDLGEKKGWGFTDTLPEGLSFANDTFTSTCGSSSTIGVNVAAGTLSVTDGDLPANAASCTITTTVTSTSADTYTNGNQNENFSELVAIDGPDNATVTFFNGSVSWQKVDASDTTKLLGGSEWTLTGPTPSTASTPEDGWPVGTVTDCVADDAAACTGPDTDPGAGGFKVSGLPSGTYTLKETKAPDGYSLSSETWTADITGSDRDVTFNKGNAITNASSFAQCSVDSDEVINQLSQGTNGAYTNKIQRYKVSTGAVTDIADLSSVVRRETNGLGISGDGRYFYVIDFNIGVSDPHIYRYDAQTGGVMTFDAANDGGGNDNLRVRRGGVNLATGVYYYSTTRMTTAATGTNATNVHNLYAFNPASGQSWFVGTVTTRDAGQSGDLAFDDSGNMYFVVGNNATAYVNVYDGRDLPTAPNETPMTIGTQFLNEVGNTGNGVGIAYGSGYLYVSNTAGSVYRVDPSTGTVDPTLQGVGSGGATVDLASCIAPSTLTVLKDYPNGRVGGADNVVLSAWRNTDTQVGQPQTTDGPAAGVQTNHVGPVPILTGTGNSYTIRETAMSGTLDAYDTSYTCIDSNDASWVGLSGTITTAGAVREANLGSFTADSATARPRAIECTFTNVPQSGSVAWEKVNDQEDPVHLADSEWKIVGPSPATSARAVTDCVADTAPECADQVDTDQRAGYFKVAGLLWGDYEVIETKAPAGYRLDSTPHAFTLSKENPDATVAGTPFVNVQVTPPSLPLTGGLGTDTFLLVGGGLLAAAGIGGWIHRRRSQQQPRA